MQRVAAWMLAWTLALAAAAGRAEEPLARFAFGSCARQDRPQPIWDAVLATQPQAFAFLGDNIYADTEDMDVLWEKYRLLGEQPGFIRLRAACPILATWDDHDYGVNDGGAEYPQRAASQRVFLDFFRVPPDDPRRSRPGVYSSRTFGPPEQRVQLILLDTRYFRSPLKTGYRKGEPGEGVRGLYEPDDSPQATMLGAEQWTWLAEQLRQPARVRLLGSSVQVVPDGHGWECWENFPRERRRLLALLRQTRAAGVVLLSGDRHLAEISRLPADAAHGPGYPLIEVTSSSLNVPSGTLTKAGARFINEINSHRVGLAYFEANFGLILIDWAAEDPVLRLQVRDAAGEVVLQHRLRLSELQPR